MKNITFIAPSNSIKAIIVLDAFFGDPFFKGTNITLVVDDDKIGVSVKYQAEAKVFLYDEVNDNCSLLDDSDYIISLGWGKIIPEFIINKAKTAFLNCHSSFLPDYKGASVYKYYWAHAESFSGASVHLLTKEIDKGNIISQQKFKVTFFDTPKSILIKASEVTAPLLKEAILKIKDGYTGTPQFRGRYFKKNISRKKLYVHRVYNLIARRANLPIWYIPHKYID